MPYVLAKDLENLVSGKHQQSTARISSSSRGSIGGGGGAGGAGSDSFIMRRSKGERGQVHFMATVTYSFSSLIYMLRVDEQI